ncbi:hypothetical protein TM1040_0023 [Ruegeria sp. TM1040]|nr:hypothetical protein TM1040_0023 [Ruegeria sp. TM1040]
MQCAETGIPKAGSKRRLLRFAHVPYFNSMPNPGRSQWNSDCIFKCGTTYRRAPANHSARKGYAHAYAPALQDWL